MSHFNDVMHAAMEKMEERAKKCTSIERVLQDMDEITVGVSGLANIIGEEKSDEINSLLYKAYGLLEEERDKWA